MKLKDFMPAEGELLGHERSDTSDEMYEIREDDRGGTCCTCIGFRASKKHPKMCKHIRRFKTRSLLQSDLNVNVMLEIIEELYG